MYYSVSIIFDTVSAIPSVFTVPVPAISINEMFWSKNYILAHESHT